MSTGKRVLVSNFFSSLSRLSAAEKPVPQVRVEAAISALISHSPPPVCQPFVSRRRLARRVSLSPTRNMIAEHFRTEFAFRVCCPWQATASVSLPFPALAVGHRCRGQFASVLSRRTGAPRWLARLDRHSIAFAPRRPFRLLVGFHISAFNFLFSAFASFSQFTEQSAGGGGNRQGSVRLRKNFSTAATE